MPLLVVQDFASLTNLMSTDNKGLQPVEKPLLAGKKNGASRAKQNNMSVSLGILSKIAVLPDRNNSRLSLLKLSIRSVAFSLLY